MPANPTARQRDMLEFIARHVYEHGYQPSYREICDHFGWAHPSAVSCHMMALARKGLVKMNKDVRAMEFRWKDYL